MMLVYSTCRDRKEAKRITKRLLEKRMIACANIFPVESMYRWEGRIKNDKEAVIIAKTKDGMFEALKDEIKRMHSYDTPCILRIDAEANPQFENWVNLEVMQR